MSQRLGLNIFNEAKHAFLIALLLVSPSRCANGRRVVGATRGRCCLGRSALMSQDVMSNDQAQISALPHHRCQHVIIQ
jgi:hypothetical protein